MTAMTRISRFAFVGVGTAALYVLFYVAFLSLGLVQGAANALAFGIAVAVQYAGQSRLTFKRQLNDSSQMLRFGVMIFCGFVTSSLITGWIAPPLGLPDWAAATAVTVILPIQNFIFMALWVFPQSSNPRQTS